MRNCKKLFHKILFLPVWLIVLLVFVCVAGIVLLDRMNWQEHPITYIMYATMTYTLTVFCIYIYRTARDIYKKVKEGVYANPIGNKYMTDAVFKAKVSLLGSLVINFGYSIFKLITGIVYSSFWWGAIAIYYMLLSLMRFLLLYYMEQKSDKKNLLLEYRSYQLCGILFLTINLSLSGIILQMVRKGMGFVYPEGFILIAAMFTFYNVTVSIVELVHYRKYKSPVISASKAIRFATALVSLLSLETAMLTVYGGDAKMYKTMTAWTGTGVCIIVLVMSIYMILHAHIEVKKIKSRQL